MDLERLFFSQKVGCFFVANSKTRVAVGHDLVVRRHVDAKSGYLGKSAASVVWLCGRQGPTYRKLCL